MIADYLFTGKPNAITAASLAELLETDKRSITNAIRRERLAGKPIIASHITWRALRKKFTRKEDGCRR